MLLKITRRPDLGRPLRGRRVQHVPALDDGRPQGPALPDQPEPVPARQQEQGPGHPERRRHVLLRPAHATAAASTTSPTAGRTSPSTCGWPRPTTAWPRSSTPPSQVTAKVGDGTAGHDHGQDPISVRGHDPTDRQRRAKPVTFPLYLRVPGWCERPDPANQRQEPPVQAEPQDFHRRGSHVEERATPSN